MILVTGGTGLVGAHLLYFLLKEENNVRAIHRSTSDFTLVKQVFSYYIENPEVLYNKIEWMEANLTDIPALTLAFVGVKKVYHAAAYISFNPKHFYKLKKSNIEGTANIVNLCLHFGIKKLCYISSVATLGSSEKLTPINEEVPWNPDADNSDYSLTKYGAEMEVWRGAQEGLDTVIVNPGIILGSGFWNSGTGAIFSKVNKGLSYFTEGEMGFVDVRDVAAIGIQLMECPIKNELFIVVSENISYKKLLTTIALAFGKTPPKTELKPWMLNITWRLDTLKSVVLGSKQNLFKSTANAMVSKKNYDNQKIKKALDYSFISIEETVKNSVSNFRKTTAF
ncbi:MAG: NAD-dependent epimerase [Bacteroidetes bacterium HGW-Bacteroidetes-2]|jgi:nucleoside-diphosphate-sugar epimerase|nr:MAG: NAD-dependent epimerase [Bacteroidetes bacterium HGW-Bacteroidetes-2]